MLLGFVNYPWKLYFNNKNDDKWAFLTFFCSIVFSLQVETVNSSSKLLLIFHLYRCPPAGNKNENLKFHEPWNLISFKTKIKISVNGNSLTLKFDNFDEFQIVVKDSSLPMAITRSQNLDVMIVPSPHCFHTFFHFFLVSLLFLLSISSSVPAKLLLFVCLVLTLYVGHYLYQDNCYLFNGTRVPTNCLLLP